LRVTPEILTAPDESRKMSDFQKTLPFSPVDAKEIERQQYVMLENAVVEELARQLSGTVAYDALQSQFGRPLDRIGKVLDRVSRIVSSGRIPS
jgi:hypothetical protein